MANYRDLIIVSSTKKAIDKAKITGEISLDEILLYQMYDYYITYTEDKEIFEEENVKLQDRISKFKQKYSKVICPYKAKAPESLLIEQEEVDLGKSQGGNNLVNPTIINFSVSDIVSEPPPGTTENYDTYNFDPADFAAAYTDMNNDATFYALVIDRTSLANGALKYEPNVGAGAVFGEDPSEIRIEYADVQYWSYYTNSSASYTHALNIKMIDKVGITELESNYAIMTVDRTTSSNQPADAGDAFYLVGNNVTTIITLAMVTSSLTPEYSDPENDLLDAIRIKEISTANQGIFYYNGLPLEEGDVITREDLNNNLFTHIGPNISSIASDVIRFEYRDEGSFIWKE